MVGMSFLILILTFFTYTCLSYNETFNTKSGVLFASLTLNCKGNTFRKIKRFVFLVNYQWGVQKDILLFLDALREYFVIYINGC